MFSWSGCDAAASSPITKCSTGTNELPRLEASSRSSPSSRRSCRSCRSVANQSTQLIPDDRISTTSCASASMSIPTSWACRSLLCSLAQRKASCLSPITSSLPRILCLIKTSAARTNCPNIVRLSQHRKVVFIAPTGESLSLKSGKLVPMGL